MIRKDKHLPLATTLLVLLLIFIWGNSLLPAEISAAISGWVWELLGDFSGGELIFDGTMGDGPLRKTAHFIEFASLGMVLLWIMILLRKHPLLALAGGFAAACIDETIQLFVPGRGPAFTDVLLDTSGVLAGVLILTLIHYWRRNHIIEN